MRWRHLIFERRVANDNLVQVKLPDLGLAHLQNAAQDVFVMLAKTIRLQLSARRPTREFCSKTWNIEFPDLPILDSVDDLGDFGDRFFMIVDEVDDLAMRRSCIATLSWAATRSTSRSSE